MKLTLATAELATALRLAGARVPARPATPPLAGIKLTAHGETVVVAAYDLDTSVQATVSAAVHEAGTVLIPGRKLRELARTLPKEGQLDLTVDSRSATFVFGGEVRVSIPVLQGDLYPTLPAPAPWPVSLTGAALARAVREVATAAGTDDTLPILTGIRVEVTGQTLRLSATDRYRGAVRELRFTGPRRRTAHVSVIPAKQLAATTWALRRTAAVSFALPRTADQRFTVSGDGIVFTHQPLGGTNLFPVMSRLLPTEFATTLTVPAQPLIEAVHRIHLVGERNVPVRLTADVAAGRLLIRSGDFTESPQFTDRVHGCTGTGEDMELAFNPHFLLEGLRALKCRTVQLSLVSPGKPALFHDATADRTALRYLAMPVRLVGSTASAGSTSSKAA